MTLLHSVQYEVLGKRPFLLTALLLAVLPAPACAQEWAFNAFLDGKPIGQHVLTLQDDGKQQRLSSQAGFKVKLLFINAYSYSHQASEIWQGDCLSSLEAHTVENRKITDVKGRLQDHHFVLEQGQAKELPACIMTFAYWNPNMLEQSKLLNPQTGEWQAVSIQAIGNESLDVRGKQTATRHYRLDGPKLHIDLWYAELQQDGKPVKSWVALKSTTPEGYVVSYQLR